MTDYKTSGPKEEEDVVDTLLRLPAKSLETQVRQFEGDIRQRQQISDEVLTNLCTHRLRLRDQLERLRYLGFAGQDFASVHKVRAAILQLDQLVTDEMINCFRDLSQLNEKLQQTQSDLERERQKIKLVESGD